MNGLWIAVKSVASLPSGQRVRGLYMLLLVFLPKPSIPHCFREFFLPPSLHAVSRPFFWRALLQSEILVLQAALEELSLVPPKNIKNIASEVSQTSSIAFKRCSSASSSRSILEKHEPNNTNNELFRPISPFRFNAAINFTQHKSLNRLNDSIYELENTLYAQLALHFLLICCCMLCISFLLSIVDRTYFSFN